MVTLHLWLVLSSFACRFTGPAAQLAAIGRQLRSVADQLGIDSRSGEPILSVVEDRIDQVLKKAARVWEQPGMI